jgi:hypothetical protein
MVAGNPGHHGSRQPRLPQEQVTRVTMHQWTKQLQLCPFISSWPVSTTPELGEGIILYPGGKGTCQLHKMPPKTGSGESLTSRGGLSYNMSKYYEHLFFSMKTTCCLISPDVSYSVVYVPPYPRVHRTETELFQLAQTWNLQDLCIDFCFFIYEDKYICIFLSHR